MSARREAAWADKASDMGKHGFNQMAAAAAAGAMIASLVSCAGAPPSPLISAISVSPVSAQLEIATSQRLDVRVSGAGGPSVFWKILEGDGGGSIDSNGLYVAPPHPGVFHVVAISAVDLSMSATATIEVVAPPALIDASQPRETRLELTSLSARSQRL